ncbi:MAG: hypothetical protein AAFV53_12995 [Myxococcota bacterium]
MRHVLCAVMLLAPAIAMAAGGDHGGDAAGDDRSIILLLTLLGIIAAAYLMAHFVVDRLQKRFLFVSGAEYILLGLLLGPQTNVLSDLASLAPVIAFLAGWIGILYGMELDFRRLIGSADHSTRLAVIDTLVTGGGVTVAAWAGFTYGMAFDSREAWLAAGAMGCAAAAGSSSAVDLLIDRYRSAAGGILSLLRRTARLGDVIAILGFGVLISIFHTGDTLTSQTPAVSDWILFTVALGVVLGGLFAAFLADDPSENSRFLALVGIIAFASGAAFFLRLSELTVNLILGSVLINTRPGKQVYRTLMSTATPVALVLLVFAGVRFEPVDLVDGLFVSGGYILARVLFKFLGGWLASSGTSVRRDIARGMMAQGHVAVAIALSFRLYYDGEAVDLAYAAILASVILSELVAPRLLKGLLVDAGDVSQDVAFALEVR